MKGNGHVTHEPPFGMGTALGIAAGATLGRPYIANAAAKTATVWVNQGFVPQEDEAFRKVAADYMKESGNKLDYSIMPFMAQNQKTISALTSGDVPDLIFMDAPATILPQNAWQTKIVDVTDVVTPYESQLTETAKLCSAFHNKTTGKRSYYLCPIKQACVPFHIWGSLVEQAGLKLSEAPNTWDAFWDFFKPAQKALRAKGMRKIYALGLQITTVGPNDGNGLFQAFMIANGGKDIVTSDGKLHTDDPKVREAAIKSCRIHDNSLQGRLYPAGGIELERCRRQQRLPREAVRDRFRWHAFHRVGDDQRQAGILPRRGDDGPAARQRRQADTRSRSAPAAAISPRARRTSRSPRT